jgi:hypothetical protein
MSQFYGPDDPFLQRAAELAQRGELNLDGLLDALAERDSKAERSTGRERAFAGDQLLIIPCVRLESAEELIGLLDQLGSVGLGRLDDVLATATRLASQITEPSPELLEAFGTWMSRIERHPEFPGVASEDFDAENLPAQVLRIIRRKLTGRT